MEAPPEFDAPSTITSLVIARRYQRRHARRHCVLKSNGSSSQVRDLRFNLLGRQYFLCVMQHPIDVLLIVPDDVGFHAPISDKPEIKIDRHQRTRVVLAAMLGQGFAVDEIL